VGKNLSQVDLEDFPNIKIIALKYLDKKLSTPALEKWFAIELNKPESDVILENGMRFVIEGRKRDIVDFLKL